jgi:hypothetical protein
MRGAIFLAFIASLVIINGAGPHITSSDWRGTQLASPRTTSAAAPADWRELSNGRLMLEDLYLDQPQCAIWPGPPRRWVCTIARNSAAEGHYGEHAEILYSTDQGLSWVTGIRLENASSPTNSYGNMLLTPFGRLAVVYSMNINNISTFPNGQSFTRDDELGFMVWRFSDDGGDTWSGDRYLVPLRNTFIDRHNSFNGTTQIFWSVDRITTTRQGASLRAYTKIGTYMQSAPEESFFVSSPNILTERNASAVTWSLYPEGDIGVQPPGGTPSRMQWEEAHVIQLSTIPGMYSVTRTSVGYLGAAVTRDDTGASGWSEGHFATFSSLNLPAAAGRRVKNPEGPITLKRFANGKYLLLFYCNSVLGYFNKTLNRNTRNPYWLAAGWEETDGEVRFSQPEIVLYYAKTLGMVGTGIGTGYPDFIEDGSSVFIMETNKTQARAHPIDATFLSVLFAADDINTTATLGLTLPFPTGSQGKSFTTPQLPDFAPQQESSVTICLWISGHSAAVQNSIIVDVGGPLRLSVGLGGALLLQLVDTNTNTNASLKMDDECTTRLGGDNSTPHYISVIIDSAAHILRFSVDGVMCDGGENQPFGWEWAPESMRDLNSNAHTSSFTLGSNYGGKILSGSWYSRALMNTEVVGNWRAH